MTSFFSERTAEYALVPALHEYLQLRYSAVSPIFFWKTREGNSYAEELHENCRVKILAMFARRPKFFGPKNLVFGKVNSELVAYAKAAMAVGIPTIAGFPAVQSVFDLHHHPPIYWLDLTSSIEGELCFTVDLSADFPTPNDEDGNPVSTITLADIANLIDDSANVLPWKEAMKRISKLRATQHQVESYFHFAWFGGYKPVYFLVSQDV